MCSQKIKRPSGALKSNTQKWKTLPENTYVTLGEADGQLVECFVKIGKGGAQEHGLSEALGRIISIALRAGISPDEIVDQLKDIHGADPTWQDGDLLLSVPHCIALSIKNWIENNETKSSTAS